jgi:steroid delta-isomerase-like uncharacterized protein
MTRNEILKFFARRDENWQRHDSAALVADHAEDGTVDSPLWGQVKGRAAIQNTYSQFYSSFPDAEFHTEHLVIDGNNAVQIGKMSGTQKGDFCGLEPAGKRFQMNCAFLFIFKDNKIAHEHRLYDFTGILVQVGVLKAKPGF